MRNLFYAIVKDERASRVENSWTQQSWVPDFLSGLEKRGGHDKEQGVCDRGIRSSKSTSMR